MADGSVTITAYGGDPRFGLQVPLETDVTVTTPGGRLASTSYTRTAVLADPGDPFSLTGQTETATLNGRTTTRSYDGVSRTWTVTSPLGRTITTRIDDQGRPLEIAVAGLDPSRFDYDLRGRLTGITTGSGTAPRQSWLTYGADGYLAALTDALGRSTAFEYDAAGRLTRQTLPDGRFIAYAYDANGNLTAITPPGRSAHVFVYDAVDRPTSYDPPDTGSPDITRYDYNLDKQLTRITRPDGQVLDLGYDPVSGRLQSQTLPRGSYLYDYDALTGQLSRITAPGGESLSFSHDGFLPLAETWSGTVTGTVSRAYDDNFWLTRLSVNGNPITFAYDADGLLTRAGELNLTRDPRHGLLTTTTLGGLSTTYGYNGSGEPTAEETTSGALVDSTVIGQDITEADLVVSGRITGASAIRIDGQSLPVAADGTITGSVPLALGLNTLSLEVYDLNGALSGQQVVTVYRRLLGTGFTVGEVLAVAPDGTAYFGAGGGRGGAVDVYRLPGGSGTPEQPVWLSGAEDVAVDATGKVYLRKGLRLTVYDGTSETELIDLGLAGLTRVDDLEVTPAGQVYVAVGLTIYRVENGALVLHSTLPGSPEIPPATRLESSAWGLVASGGFGVGFRRIEADGSTTALFDINRESDFALDDAGTVCYPDLGSVTCVAADGSQSSLALATGSLEYGPDGALYHATGDNLHRWASGTDTALIQTVGTPVQGVLQLSGTAGGAWYSASYSRDALGRITQKTETIAGMIPRPGDGRLLNDPRSVRESYPARSSSQDKESPGSEPLTIRMTLKLPCT